MATDHAIAAVSQGIAKLLEDACPLAEFPNAVIRPVQALNFKPLDEGVSVLLFRVTPNTARRSLPQRIDLDGRRFRPSIPVDLQYLIAAWAVSAEMQQRMLGWAIRVLEDTPILPPGLLNLASPTPVFAPNECVEVFLDPLPLADLLSLWDRLRTGPQPSVTYTARAVYLDSQEQVPDSGPAQTRVFDIQGGPRS